ncbi:hypothetical protein Naga_101726g2 [Nannochloropsis gaditana]|uniref:Uncharacterized protein n=1 Tax=Nannochloropsis gaditana TaxID=72520 RepID=W7TJ15_9STRA|nr:hypothetical protein Naga_101726g2 [Nannochloropsis gaditana]
MEGLCINVGGKRPFLRSTCSRKLGLRGADGLGREGRWKEWRQPSRSFVLMWPIQAQVRCTRRGAKKSGGPRLVKDD